MKSEKLKKRIRDSGMTQRELADALGISREHLNAKLNGKWPFDANEILRVQNAVGLSFMDVIDLFFCGED